MSKVSVAAGWLVIISIYTGYLGLLELVADVAVAPLLLGGWLSFGFFLSAILLIVADT